MHFDNLIDENVLNNIILQSAEGQKFSPRESSDHDRSQSRDQSQSQSRSQPRSRSRHRSRSRSPRPSQSIDFDRFRNEILNAIE